MSIYYLYVVSAFQCSTSIRKGAYVREELYTVEKAEHGPLIRSYACCYEETIIVNNTLDTVVVIDDRGNKTTLQPTFSRVFGYQNVSIYTRACVGPTVTSQNGPAQLPGKAYNIPKSSFEYQPCFVEELNILICTYDMANQVSHPRQRVTYSDALNSIVEDIKELKEEFPHITISANDPEGRCNKLYTSLGDTTVTIPVTDIEGKPRLYVTTIQNSIPTVQEFDLNLLLDDSDCDVLELENTIITYITTNRLKAMKYTKDFKKVTQAEVDDLIKKLTIQQKKEVDTLKEEHAVQSKEQELKISKLETTNTDLKNKLEQTENQYNSLKGDLDYKAIRQQDMNKAIISTNNVESTQIKKEAAKDEAQFKLWHLLLAGGIPTASALAIKIIDYYSKKKAPADVAYQIFRSLPM